VGQFSRAPKVARTLRFAPGTILANDRGYNDYQWFRELTQKEVYFVTRMKERAVYEVIGLFGFMVESERVRIRRQELSVRHK
jgi:hypothetical protein